MSDEEIIALFRSVVTLIITPDDEATASLNETIGRLSEDELLTFAAAGAKTARDLNRVLAEDMGISEARCWELLCVTPASDE